MVKREVRKDDWEYRNSYGRIYIEENVIVFNVIKLWNRCKESNNIKFEEEEDYWAYLDSDDWK